MAKINESELRQQLKDGELSNAYLIYGEETYLKDYYVKKLEKAAVEPAFADFNYHKYEGSNTCISDIIQDALTLPVMARYTFIIVNDYPLVSSESDIKEIKEFLSDLPDTCILVFKYDTVTVDVFKNSKWRGVISAFEKNGSVVELSKRTESDTVKFIISAAKKNGCTIDSKTARYLISTVGNDLKTVSNETQKLCFFAENGVITTDCIDRVAVKSLQARVFDLSKFILAGNSDAAYNVLNALFSNKEEPIAVLAILASCYIDMYRVKCAKAANENEAELKKYYNYKNKEFLISNASRNCRKISTESLRKSIDVLASTDEMLKSTSVDGRVLLEETTAKLLEMRNG